MDELLKYLIEQIKSRRWGADVLLFAAVLSVDFSLALYLRTEPQASAVLQDRYFQSSAVLLTSLWIASICWRFATFRTLRFISTGAVVLAGVVTAALLLRSMHVEQLRVRVAFDGSIIISPGALNQLLSRLQSPLFDLEVDDRPLSINVATEGTISLQEVQIGLVSAGILGTPALPVLVTARDLRNEEWTHLLSLTFSDHIVISTWGIGTTELSDEVVARYVATSIALETLVAYAQKRDAHILKDRTPGLNRGCLNDFHRTRQTYVMQTQQPELCDAEAEGIRLLFGEGAVISLKARAFAG